jgi:hypothetical protein
MLRGDTATCHQQVNLYPALILALSKDDLSIVEYICETYKNCDLAALAALVDHYEDDGVYCLSELLQDMEVPQGDSESSIQNLNRLVGL